MKKLKKIGFFRELKHGESDGGSLLELKNKSTSDDQIKIVEYLRSGNLFIATPGLVNDVIDPSNGVIGSPNILTDGEWAWPEDLCYYVEKYNIQLPFDFIETLKSNSWTVPSVDLTQIEL